jgi:hypothetical protein
VRTGIAPAADTASTTSSGSPGAARTAAAIAGRSLITPVEVSECWSTTPRSSGRRASAAATSSARTAEPQA